MTAALSQYYPTFSFTLSNNKLNSFLQVIGASFLIALCAKIRIPLFFSPVPLTFQTLSILFVGVTLGSRKGAWSVILYLLEDFLAFSVWGSELLSFFRPTGGYFLGFIVQAYLAGWIIERQSSFKSVTTFFGLLFSCAVQMGFGVLILSQFVGWNQVMVMGFYPFILGEMIKVLFVTTYLKSHFQRIS